MGGNGAASLAEGLVSRNCAKKGDGNDDPCDGMRAHDNNRNPAHDSYARPGEEGGKVGAASLGRGRPIQAQGMEAAIGGGPSCKEQELNGLRMDGAYSDGDRKNGHDPGAVFV